MNAKLHGLIAATHTPFAQDGELNLPIIERQAAHLLATGVSAAFIGGTTGESHSLTVNERLALAQRWSDVIRGSTLRLVVHVGSNCLADARTLAAQAQAIGATAISALAPSYFKPRSVQALVECCAQVAGAAPQLPFYFYDIPSMTGVQLSMPQFLAAAPAQIANLAGIKFTNWDLAAYLRCLQIEGGRFDVPWGMDEHLLAALAVGAAGAVGSSYNFAAPIYLRIMAAFKRGDLAAARMEQLRSVRLIELLAGFGYMAAAKAAMGMIGVEVGPPRLPHGKLTDQEQSRLRQGLEEIGFFQWIEK